MGRRTILAMLHITAFAALIFASMPNAFTENLSGQASVIDGDTLEIYRTRIRLWGIDAPESDQLCRGDDSLQYRCGQQAANDLDALSRVAPSSALKLIATETSAPLQSAPWPVSISRSG